MAKSSIQFACQECGSSFSKWAGRCSNCGAWNSLVEEVAVSRGSIVESSKGKKLTATAIGKVAKTQKATRLTTGVNDVDVVLGGGFVSGSVNLIAGQPGIGKSTLLMQLSAQLSRSHQVLYVSGEESLEQVSLRASRITPKDQNVMLASSTSSDDIAETILSSEYQVVIVDSIQTVSCASVSSAPGSISQITNSTYLLTQAAKQANVTLILVGHVTKEGNIAGPKLMEHLVDVVLNLEGDRYGGFKVLRAVKNRYGSTSEVGIFDMTEGGLTPVDNPSAVLLAERQVADGSIVLAAMEGTRPILVEVQALVNRTSFGYPKRAASGFDLNRLNLLTAVLTRRTKLDLSEFDVYINIVGGIKISEPAADLAICMAIASAAKGMQLNEDAVVFGEVGLSGEVRHVSNIEKRIKEANYLGFKNCIGPKSDIKNTKLQQVTSIKMALNTYLKDK
ncbi:DNA repair protein RadA [Candidatus Nomurabacteria bacterium]|nr:DNA repair protein RadA [Candidatus Saccharibacteria bacterium]MCA9313519.1 DNA repair protein RadA [Candidatus Saccharibacteria bacterium]MCB9821800.1 DNA repair protein RadA [Candidatus Nomurabacteria bacterium]